MLLTQNHDNAGLLGTFGTLLLQQNRLGLAIALLERAAAKTPQGDILCNLGIAYKQSGQYAKCKEIFAKAMKHEPSAEVLCNYAALFINVGTPDEAIKHARRAISLDQNNGMAHWNLAIAHLEKGEWATGWDEHDWGFKSQPVMRVDRGAKFVPAWDGTPGQKVWVYGEQGIGDEIMFASMLPDVLKTNEVVLESHTRLKTLFERSFGVKCYGTREGKEIAWLDDEQPQARISIGSLGKFYRRSKEAFPGTPYLKAEPLLPNGRKMRVGVSWTGGLKPGRVRSRTVPLAWWQSILNNDCEFVSLQYTEDAETDIEAMNRQGYDIQQHPAAKAHDYYETARLVRSCDLVISVCTSVIHLAGALGVPCWVMVPNKPAWRYGVKGPMQWYRSVRLYRQPEGDADSWMPVVQRVGLDLSELVAERAQRAA